MNKQQFNNFVKNVSSENIIKEYNDNDDEYLRLKYGLSYGNLKELKKMFNLYRTKEYISIKRKKTWENHPNNSINNLKQLQQLITKESFYEYYIKRNNSIKDTAKHFNVTSSVIIRLIREYNCHKSKRLSSEIVKKTKLERYGDENYRNDEMIKKTCLEKYGVDNIFKDREYIRESYIKKLGVDHPMKVDSILQKQQSSALNNHLLYGSLGPCGCMSSCNIAFKIFLDNHGLTESYNIFDTLHYSREYHIERYSYDFRIGNILIEINPFSTHNSTWSPFRREPKEKNYHLNKSKVAWLYGFKCFHIWDWDNLEDILQLIIHNEDGDNLDKCYLDYKNTDNIKEMYYIFDTKTKSLTDKESKQTVRIYSVGVL